jgi:para-nitrobenzyl esterase
MQVASGRAPVFAYWFDRRHPYAPGVAFSDLDPATTGINHTDDVPFWLGTFDSLNGARRTRDWRAKDRALGARMRAAVIAFAATGDPNNAALGLRWPRYTPAAEQMLGFGDTVRLLAWPDRDRMDRLVALGIPEPRSARKDMK